MSGADVDMAVTPSGIKIVYRDSNHRYQIAKGDEKLAYVPSVSTVLKGAVPINLSSWAERGAVDGVLEVMRLEPTQVLEDWTTDEALAYMDHLGLRWWQRRAAAAERGTSVHSALETLSEGKVPKLSSFPLHERGYLRGVFSWWSEYLPEILHSEVMLASHDHGFAGRADLICKLDGHPTIVDLKTSKGIFDSHHYQLAGYRLAAWDSGYLPEGVEPSTAALRVGDDGAHELRYSWARTEQFLSLLGSYKAQKQFAADTPKEFKPTRKKAA